MTIPYKMLQRRGNVMSGCTKSAGVPTSFFHMPFIAHINVMYLSVYFNIVLNMGIRNIDIKSF